MSMKHNLPFHDSQAPLYRFPAGAQSCGAKVMLRIACAAGDVPTLRLWQGYEKLVEMTQVGRMEDAFLWQAEAEMPNEPGWVWYCFVIQREQQRLFYGNALDGLGGEGQLWPQMPPSFQITVYDAAYRPPCWLRDGVMLQIFPDRFYDGRSGAYFKRRPEIRAHKNWDEQPDYVPEGRSGDNRADDFFGGNLEGIRQKLPFIRDMGFTVIYLNPIFAARSNHRYDTADYTMIDPLLGDEQEFARLCRDAKEMGIRIMIDGVFSHCGEDSRYFDRYGRYGGGAWSDPQSKYRDWFKFEKWPEKYTCWWGVPTLPEIQEDNPEYRNFILNPETGVVPRWLRLGASGWRLDVADELPDSFIRDIRAAARKANPEAAVLGEVWEDVSNKVSYGELRKYALGDELDSAMNYPLREALMGFFMEQISAQDCARRIRSLQENYPPQLFYSLMNLIGSHDRARILTLLAGVEADSVPKDKWPTFCLTDKQLKMAKQKLIALWKTVCCLPGMPCLYYGDDAGMQGMPDPYCRGTYPWGKEDKTLQTAMRECISMRKENEVWTKGDLTIDALQNDVLFILRSLDENSQICLVNRSKYEQNVVLDAQKWGIKCIEGAKTLSSSCFAIQIPGMCTKVLACKR